MEDREVDELQRIWELKEKGAISDEEYARLKQRILHKQARDAPVEPDAILNRTQAVRTPTPVAGHRPNSNYSTKTIASFGCLAIVALFIILAAVGGSSQHQTDNNANNTETDTNAVAALSPQERQAQTRKLLADLKSVPTSDFKRNHDLYSKLAELNPDLQKYATKRNEYADKMDAAKGPVTEPELSPEEYEAHPEEALAIKNFRWTKEGFGNVMSVSFTVKNAAPFPIKDFDVKCVHSAPSGTQIDENERTIYEMVPAHGSKAIRDFNMGFIESQAASSYCTITSASKA